MLINSRFKMIVCDMAGTIIKENNIVYKTLYEVIKSFNDSLLQEDINKFKGFNKLEVIDHFVKKQGLPIRESRLLIKQSNNKFNSLLKEKYSVDKNVKLIHMHLPNLLNALRDNDKKIVLNTGYNKEIQNILINKFSLNKCIDDYISSEEVKVGRPYPYMIYNLMESSY